jgi:small-conductance mechanosensitive channel
MVAAIAGVPSVSLWSTGESKLPVPAQSSAEETIDIGLQHLLEALIVLVIAYFLARAVSFLLSTLADRFASQRFRVTLLIPLIKFLIYGLGLYVVVSISFDLSTRQLVAFSGLLGAALGLGLKDFLADIVGGLVVVLEQPYQVGDKVTLGDHYGEIVDIGIRSTKLQTPNDTLVVVPNFFFFNDSIANANASEAEMLVVVEFHVATDVDVDRARTIVSEALVTSPYVYVSEDHPYTVVVEDNLYYRTLTGKAYVNDLRNEFAFKSDVTERVLATFDEEGIESPKLSPKGEDGAEVPR